MTICLFIGGPNDGERHDVDTSISVWRLHTREVSALPFGANHCQYLASYLRYPVCDQDGPMLFVYVYESWRGHGVLTALITGYRRSP